MAVGALGSLGCRAPLAPQPNVLLVTLDTVRADRLSAYGFDLPTTPFLEQLARRGSRFERAYAASNITKPSHASILTGLHLKHHGILTNNETVLHEGIETLAERFRHAGYVTLAVVATNLLDAERSGLAQGFDIYADADPGGPRRHRRERLLQRSAPEVVETFLGALGERPSEPFFAWVHFYDAHTPYRPPPDFVERFLGPESAEEPASLPAIAPFAGTSMVRGAIPHTSALGTRRDPRFYEASYHGELAFLDANLARLFRGIDALSLRRPLLAAITADHGEMLGERGIYYNHASLEEPVIRVPLILVGAGVPSGVSIDAVVESVDLAPTLAELAALAPGAPQDGESLVPLFAGRPAGDGFAFSQHGHDLAISVRHCRGALMSPLPAGSDWIVTPFSKFSRRAYLAYLDLEAQRFQPADSSLAGSPCSGAELGELDRRLIAWYRERGDYPAAETVPIAGEEAARLRALGYL
ncbi:MAG: sulfatase [Thermoanaerobaculia bacterium]